MVRVRYSFSSRRTGKVKNISRQRPKFPEVLQKVVAESDIILEVLDSRFFMEMRNKGVEELIRSSEKKLIYVLNKSDLVDVKKIPQEKFNDFKPFIFVSAKSGESFKKLKDRLKIEAKRLGVENKKVFVGVIGYPNTGKSSVINRLARRGAAGTSKQAGFTKGTQKVKLAENLYILDTPGVIPEEEYSSDSKERMAKDLILGGRTYSNVKNPDDIVLKIMNEYVGVLERHYKIESNGDNEILIEELGKKMNFLKKGGVVDFDRTARFILRDWQEGKVLI